MVDSSDFSLYDLEEELEKIKDTIDPEELKELEDQEGQYNKTIDLGNKANGIYMLNITTKNQSINHKIVIH